MASWISIVFGVVVWVQGENFVLAVILALLLRFLLGALGLVIELFTTKEGGVILGLLALFGLGFLLGSGGDDEI